MGNTAHILICSYAMCVEWQLWRTCHSAVMGLGADGQPTCSSALGFWGPKSSWGSFNHLLVSGLCWCTEHAQTEMMRAWTWGLCVVLNSLGLTTVFGRGNILRAAVPGGHKKTASYLMAYRRKTHKHHSCHVFFIRAFRVLLTEPEENTKVVLHEETLVPDKWDIPRFHFCSL